MTPSKKMGSVQIPLDIQEELRGYLLRMGTILIGSGGEMHRYSLPVRKEMMLEALINAAKSCWDRKPEEFVKLVSPQSVAKQTARALRFAVFDSTSKTPELERNHTWLRRMLEQLAEDGEPEKRLATAFECWKMLAEQVPLRPRRRPPDEVADVLSKIDAAYYAHPRQPIRHLLPTHIRPGDIGRRAGLKKDVVSKFLGGKRGVGEDNFKLARSAVASLLRSAP